MGKHWRDPLRWDIEGEWDGRVMSTNRGFIRYLDRNGEQSVVLKGETTHG